MEHILNRDTVAKIDFVSELGVPFTYDIREELKFSDATYTKDAEEHPAKYAYWVSILERTKQKATAKSDSLDYIKASLENDARKVLTKPTVSAIEDYVIVQEEYQQALAELRFWQGRVGMITGIVKGLEHREQMLIQKGKLLKDMLSERY